MYVSRVTKCMRELVNQRPGFCNTSKLTLSKNLMTKFQRCLYLSNVDYLPVDELVVVDCSNLSQIPLQTLNPDPGSSEG